MANEAERMHILQMIEDGKISAAEGLRLLNALAGSGSLPSGDASGQAASPAPDLPAAKAPPDPGLERWRRWWTIPMGIGSGITFLGALFMYWAYSAGGFGFWFACAALPFAFGVLVMALASASRTAKWIHIRVKTGASEGPKHIAISFPLPIGLTAWALRTFGQFIPKLRDTGVDELITALGETTSAQTPLYVDVDEGEEGEKVKVYIG